MEKKTFSTFNDLRKESYGIIKDYREGFVRVVLKKFGIDFAPDIRKRAFNELLEEHNTTVTRNEKLNRDEIHINEKLVAYWNRDVELEFRKGSLVCKIYFFVKE
jgi:hypothetical protein